MLLFQILYISVFIIYVISAFVLLISSRKLIKILFINGFAGIAFLMLLKIFEKFIKLNICINIVSVYSALIFGPIGVVFNLIVNYLVF